MPRFRIYEVLRRKVKSEVILPGLEATQDGAIKKAWAAALGVYERQKAKGIHHSDKPIQYELWHAEPVDASEEGTDQPVAYVTTEEYHSLRQSVLDVKAGYGADDAVHARWKALAVDFDHSRLPEGYTAPYQLENWRAEPLEDDGFQPTALPTAPDRFGSVATKARLQKSEDPE